MAANSDEYLDYYDPHQSGYDYSYADQSAQTQANPAGQSNPTTGGPGFDPSKAKTVTYNQNTAHYDANGNPSYDPNDIQGPTIDDPSKSGTPAPTPGPQPGTGGPGGLPPAGHTNDPSAIRKWVDYWAAMPDADPSLKNDPDYWVRRITETGGLGTDNTQYWQNAGVGSTAFFRNPGREGGGTIAPGPMIMPNGTVPPGMPYSPNTSRAGFNQTPPTYQAQTISQFQTPDYSKIQGMQDNVLQNVLTNPMYSQEYTSRLNEQQKELALARGQAASRGAQQNAISRGTAGSGAAMAAQRRIGQGTTQNLLQSQRDISNTVESGNRQGYLDALGASQNVLTGRGNQASQFYNSLLSGQQAQAAEYGRQYQSQGDAFDRLLGRDMGLEGLDQAAANSRLGYANFGQQGAQFDQDLAYRYNSMNNNNQLAFMRMLLGGS